MVSGALLLPVETDTKTFLKKRLAKIVVPTLVWTIVYWGYNVVTKGDEHWIQTIASIPFSPQGHGVMLVYVYIDRIVSVGSNSEPLAGKGKQA